VLDEIGYRMRARSANHPMGKLEPVNPRDCIPAEAFRFPRHRASETSPFENDRGKGRASASNGKGWGIQRCPPLLYNAHIMDPGGLL